MEVNSALEVKYVLLHGQFIYIYIYIYMSSSGTHMVAPEAYKPYVGGNSNRCGTCDYNYKV